MAAGEGVATQIDQLVELFNSQSMDLPDGLFTRHTQFLLNGVAFEEMLGRSPSDPLILMLTRGPAGYRFTAKAVRHAVPDATLQRGELRALDDGDAHVVRGQCWLSGHLRGEREPVEVLVDVEMRWRRGAVERVAATLDPSQLKRLQEGRRRP